jgi:hypothetical protein
MNNNLELIRQKCIEAGGDTPNFCCKYQTYDPKDFCDDCLSHSEPTIRLADILLAIKAIENWNDYPIQVNDNVAFGAFPNYIELAWNLRKDDLNEQSEETINFFGRNAEMKYLYLIPLILVMFSLLCITEICGASCSSS